MSTTPQSLEGLRAGIWQRDAVLVVAAGLLCLLFLPAFARLAERWNLDPNYSHGWLVPAASLVFAWQGRRRAGATLRRVPAKCVKLGLVWLTGGLVLHAQAWISGFLLMDVVALVISLCGLLWIVAGRRGVRAYGFSVLFLVFMAPLPFAWQQPLALCLQNLVTVASEAVLSASGVPVLREGYLLRLPGQVMEVAEGCSGLRQFMAFLALSTAVAGLSRCGRFSRGALVLCAGPVAVGANCLRIVLTGFILMLFGREWAEGTFHTLEGLATMAIGLVGLMAIARGLFALEQRQSRLGQAASVTVVQMNQRRAQ